MKLSFLFLSLLFLIDLAHAQNPLNEWPSEITLSVFPNPFHSTVSIKVQATNSGRVIFAIRDMLGQVVSAREETTAGYKFTRTLDWSLLPQGVYLLEVTIGEERVFEKIL